MALSAHCLKSLVKGMHTNMSLCTPWPCVFGAQWYCVSDFKGQSRLASTGIPSITGVGGAIPM
ncbi:hypothetical protein B1J92_B03611g [Nakaseomyces glabratus]|nr:hypothetical protein B1J91_B03611g [Nakaseomyces glabratus]OXB50505.1 hypothetical protein B1J92_B03611g [Nakaseomyces glabratus]